jgi:hypothetical protein
MRGDQTTKPGKKIPKRIVGHRALPETRDGENVIHRGDNNKRPAHNPQNKGLGDSPFSWLVFLAEVRFKSAN